MHFLVSPVAVPSKPALVLFLRPLMAEMFIHLLPKKPPTSSILSSKTTHFTMATNASALCFLWFFLLLMITILLKTARLRLATALSPLWLYLLPNPTHQKRASWWLLSANCSKTNRKTNLSRRRYCAPWPESLALLNALHRSPPNLPNA